MRSCAAAGATTSTMKHRNTIVRLRMMCDPVKLPVLPDRVEILPVFGAVLEPAHQVVEARDGDHGNSAVLLDFPDRRQIPLAPLHPVERNNHPRYDRAAPFDDVERLAHRGARGQYIIHDQHAARKRRADEIPAFSVIFCLLAIECERHIAAFARQGHRRPRGKDDAFVGRTEQQNALLDAEGDEVLAKVGHGLNPKREIEKCYALSRSTSTASVRRSPRAFRGGSRASAPTWCACRRSRRRKLTSRASRSFPRGITPTMTAARRKRATAASRCTPGSNPGTCPAVTAAASSTRRGDFFARISPGSPWYRRTCRRVRARRKGSRPSSASWKNSCRCSSNSRRAAANSFSAATGTSPTRRST